MCGLTLQSIQPCDARRCNAPHRLDLKPSWRWLLNPSKAGGHFPGRTFTGLQRPVLRAFPEGHLLLRRAVIDFCRTSQSADLGRQRRSVRDPY